MQRIRIIKESEDWLALDKPLGVSIHNRPGADLNSFILSNCKNLPKPYPVNRLDSGTTGLVLFAKNAKTAKYLSQIFEKREVTKTYLARVHTLKNTPHKGDQGLWRWPLTNRAEGRSNPKGFWKKRIPCQTEWEVLNTMEKTADLRINLLTGRKHQIRRHSAIFGWPIMGDPRYGPLELQEFGAGNLIAKKLTFLDPCSLTEVTIESQYSLEH